MARPTASNGSKANRPLSPHLQVYKPIINMVMSIIHRMTGAALYVGSLLLAWWLVSAAVSPTYFAYVNDLFASPFGQLVLFGYTWALLHHMLGGVRHFIWDTGRGFEIQTINALSWATIALSASLTALIWGWALFLK